MEEDLLQNKSNCRNSFISNIYKVNWNVSWETAKNTFYLGQSLNII